MRNLSRPLHKLTTPQSNCVLASQSMASRLSLGLSTISPRSVPGAVVQPRQQHSASLFLTGDFINGGISSLWQTNMDILRLLNGQPTELNLQTIDPIVRVGGTNSNYNALFVSLHRQISRGLTFDVNYTVSRSLD